MYKHSLYLGPRFLDSFSRPAPIIHAERQPARSMAYFCPHCGEVWARAVVEGCLQWDVSAVYCRDHPGPSPFVVAGSLLLSWDAEYTNCLLNCPDVVKWEFERHMEFYERRIANDRSH